MYYGMDDFQDAHDGSEPMEWDNAPNSQVPYSAFPPRPPEDQQEERDDLEDSDDEEGEDYRAPGMGEDDDDTDCSPGTLKWFKQRMLQFLLEASCARLIDEAAAHSEKLLAAEEQRKKLPEAMLKGDGNEEEPGNPDTESEEGEDEVMENENQVWELSDLGFVVDFDSSWKDEDNLNNQKMLPALTGLDAWCALISGKQKGRVILVYKKLYALVMDDEDPTDATWPYAVAMLRGMGKEEGIEVTKAMVDALEEEMKTQSTAGGAIHDFKQEANRAEERQNHTRADLRISMPGAFFFLN
ncbi:hypothetical protein Ndes2437B_g00666 [Nannochloris sp. 'desiccata']